jgi:hypothetical protein
MKKFTSILALVIATSIYLFCIAGLCAITYSLLGLGDSIGIYLTFGNWLSIVIIVKTLFIDSQSIFTSKTKKDDK